jgi:hypothetical protein
MLSGSFPVVTPAKAGVHRGNESAALDARFRGHDNEAVPETPPNRRSSQLLDSRCGRVARIWLRQGSGGTGSAPALRASA